MSATITIPNTSLPPGTYEFPSSGGKTVGSKNNVVDISIDRTVAGGLNSLTSAVTFGMTVFKSVDGGTTWQQLATTSTMGGDIINKRTGLPFTTAELVVTYGPAAGDLLRAEVVVAGGTVVVQGSVVFTG